MDAWFGADWIRPDIRFHGPTIEEGSNYLLVSSRRFFVGHTYESSQAFTLMVEKDDKIYVFQYNATATDKITGCLSGCLL